MTSTPTLIARPLPEPIWALPGWCREATPKDLCEHDWRIIREDPLTGDYLARCEECGTRQEVSALDVQSRGVRDWTGYGKPPAMDEASAGESR